MTKNQDALIGTILQNRYRVVRVIGEGGMGVVYEGEHIAVERLVAIKCLHPELDRDPDIIKRLQREARAAAYTGNEHVVEVLDLDVLPNGSPFLVLEYLDGINLDQLVESNGPLELGRVARIMVQVCDALEAVHQADIVHRDLKPDNIFLVPRGANPDFVKVLDFGISKFKSSLRDQATTLTTPGKLVGTPRFMAPEQIKDDLKVDRRADIFALGAILYYALTANVPFTADTLYTLWSKICCEPPPSVLRLRPDLPVEIEQIIQKAMEKDPRQRFADCAEMKSKLWPYLDRSPEIVSIAPCSPPKSHKRIRNASVLLGGIAVASVIAVHFIAFDNRSPSGKRPPPDKIRTEIEIPKPHSTELSNRSFLAKQKITVTVPVEIDAAPARAMLFLDEQRVSNPFHAELPLSKKLLRVKALLDGRIQTREFIPDRKMAIHLDFAGIGTAQNRKHQPATRSAANKRPVATTNASGSINPKTNATLDSDKTSVSATHNIEKVTSSLSTTGESASIKEQPSTRRDRPVVVERTGRDSPIASKRRRPIPIREE